MCCRGRVSAGTGQWSCNGAHCDAKGMMVLERDPDFAGVALSDVHMLGWCPCIADRLNKEEGHILSLDPDLPCL